jgi:hypothetical protein
LFITPDNHMFADTYKMTKIAVEKVC